MTLFKKLSMATAVSTLLATGVVAQDNTGSSGGMMDGEMSGMQGMDGMQGMMPMMQMMQMMQMMMQMGPMMKACTEMMEAMNDSMHETAPSTDKG